jgi:site-specific DNA-cytosine methylase
MDVESDDELGAESPPKKRKSKIQDNGNDAFMVDENQLDIDDEFDEEAEDAENSSTAESYGEDNDDDVPRTKSAKRSQAKAVGKNEDGQPNTKPKGTRRRMVNLKSGTMETKKINYGLPPLFEIEDIFSDLTAKARTLGLDKAVKHLDARPIRVATMCSGTESPLLALEMIKECLSKSELNLEIEHLFSAEIVPFKQAYIERNFNPPVIFRDITELTFVVDEDKPVATTAYGGKAPVPKEVDMVIAGTSCVDFSGLNTHQKTMDDGGESADTWNAVLSYCRAFRPAIVLLENVSGADWDRMLADYEKIDYECSGASVNTRDYYLPQVRERGYMACFNKNSLDYRPGLADKWVKLMGQFKRASSSPVSDFLIPNDQIVQKLIRNDEPSREFDWAQCQITQMEYRQDMRLGWARPVTHWSESGWMLPPDNGHAAWYHNQVERVLDTIDAAVLRKALDMYDCRFKTRIFDLSQNIYRETDHRPFGIAGCITPSGIYKVTDLGRVLTSEETLKLQGIPLQKICFATETQPEIQSLAGNAMSSTVIAASILSALISGYRSIETPHHDVPRCGALQNQSAYANRRLVSLGSDPLQAPLSNHQSFDLTELLRRADLAQRRCFCEGATGIAVKPIQQCEKCGHTTCTTCGGNPTHEYRQDHTMSENRMSPADFEDYVRSVMPLRLAYSEIEPRNVAWPSEEYGKAATAAMRSSFAFSNIRRTHCWTVTYTSESAVLELVLSTSQAEWRLYAAPSSDLPGNSLLRRMLEQPVARSGVLNGGGIFTSDWYLRIPEAKAKPLPLSIASSGPVVASWWSRMEMPDFTDHTVPAFLHISVKGNDIATAVSGKYRYLPRCGKACNSLYKKVGGEEPMFLFLDPTRTGEPEDDCFVFSRNIDLLEKDEVRPILARVASSWRPWANKGKSKVAAETKTQLLVDEAWQALLCSLAASEVELDIMRCSEPAALANSTKCSELAVLISCHIPADIAELVDGEQRIIHAEDSKFFKTYAWAFEVMRRHLLGNEWQELHGHIYAGARCKSCAPTRPSLRWGLSEDGKELRPYEDPREAALYERAIKSRPDPVVVVTSPRNGLTLDLCLDVATLAHRAGSRLPKDLTILYIWKFATNGKRDFKFTPFKLCDTRDSSLYAGQLDMSITLFPQQLKSLTWMREQEQGVDFELEEAEEATIKSLGWRAEVRATATKTVRGGICADHPGFGKTITSLALIYSEFCASTASAIRAELEPRANGFLAHAGTLIVCPASLIEQWVDEIRDKIQYGKQKVCVLRSVADLTKHTVPELQSFRIVVVNRTLLFNDTYIERLAAFAGIPGPVSTKGRPFTQWLEFAHKQIPNHLKVRATKGPKAFKSYIESLYRERVQSDEFKAAIPSKRLTGADYIAGKEKKITSQAKVQARSSVVTTHLDKPLLAMFHWNRVIVDEFHQSEAKIPNIVVSAMQADKRWGLSATPALGDFYEVARMAELIGVPLRIGSDGAGIMKNASVKELRKDMTNFELFDAMRQVPSDSMHNRIHEIDQRFLDAFVRQNIMDYDQMRYQDHLVPVTLDLDHRAMYAELSQHLNSSDMRIKKKNSKATDRDKRFNEAVSTSTTAEEALSKVAAFSNRNANGRKEMAVDLDAIVQDRKAAVDKILAKLPAAMSEAKGTEVASFTKWVKSCLEDGTLGDADTIEQLAKVAKVAKGVKVNAAEMKRRKDPGKRALTALLNGLCNRLLVENRSARYTKNICNLEQAARQGGDIVDCDSVGCLRQKSHDVAISALCGHMICRKCYDLRRESEGTKCPGNGCSSSMADHHLFWPNKVGDLSTATPFGAKIKAAMDLLDAIKAKGEQAILFVQYSNQLEEVDMALKNRKIDATVVQVAEKASLQIKDFQETAGTKQQKTVIVLNSSDETAAGSNLQNANHVIFLSPLLKDTQYGYDSTMAQTIGRVRRHGQKKEIHIYRIVALDTIDVDILEHRERRSDALVEQGAPRIARPANTATATATERTQLVRENDRFSLRPQSWLVDPNADRGKVEQNAQKVKGKNRVLGWEDFSSIVKFSKNFTEDDE